MGIQLDLKKPHALVSGKTKNNVRYIQDGLNYKGDCSLVMDTQGKKAQAMEDAANKVAQDLDEEARKDAELAKAQDDLKARTEAEAEAKIDESAKQAGKEAAEEDAKDELAAIQATKANQAEKTKTGK